MLRRAAARAAGEGSLASSCAHVLDVMALKVVRTLLGAHYLPLRRIRDCKAQEGLSFSLHAVFCLSKAIWLWVVKYLLRLCPCLVGWLPSKQLGAGKYTRIAV